MAGEMIDRKPSTAKGDLVICLDTGSIGVVIEVRDNNGWLISFPHGNYILDVDDFDILKSG